MPSSVGPNTKGEENLVFGYDLGDSKNSFPGIPAVNCATVPDSGYNWTVTEVTDGSIPPPRKGARVFKFECTNASNLHRQGGYYNGGGFGGYNPTPLILGKTSPSNFTTVGTGKYRFGMWVRGAASNGSAYWAIDIGDLNGVGISVDNNTNWQFISTTDAAGINSTAYPYDFFDINANVGTYYVADYGIFRAPGTVDDLPALQAYPQWVDYQQERSYAAGLLDLTGNTTINLNDVSFDSNAQMEFDGTDDQTTLLHADSPITNLTYELVVRIDSIPASNSYRSIWQKSANWNGTTGISMQMIYGSLTFSYGEIWGGTVQYPLSNLTAGNWYHIVGTADSTAGSDVRFYINGTLVDTGTSSQTPTTTSNLTIGLGNGGSFDGPISIFKMYSRALTASEIKSNFNAIKGRFNI